jgi:hypothetical protein
MGAVEEGAPTMPRISVSSPGEADLVLELGDAPVTLGRGEDCTGFLVEKKASRKHLTIRARPEGAAVAEDHGSSNGTWFVGGGEDGTDQRFLRRLLADGDQLRIGDTLITFHAGPAAATGPAPTALVSGTLQLTPAAATPSALPTAAAAPSEIPPADARRPARTSGGERDGDGGAGPRSRGSMGKALALVAVAIAAFAGIEIFLGASADKKAERKTAHLEALRTLEKMDEGLTAFQAARDAYALKFKDSPDLLTLDRYLEQLGEREAYARTRHAELDVVLRNVGTAPRSEMRFKLLQLRADLREDETFQREIRDALAGLDRQQMEEDLEGLRTLESEVETLLTARRFAQAMRLVDSYDDTHEGMQVDAKERWTSLKGRVDAAYKQASTDLWTRVEAEKDPARSRRLLADAWPRLVGTGRTDAIGDRLRSAASLAAPRSGESGVPTRPPGSTNPTPGQVPTPAVPTVSDSLLARATKAEELLVAREWAAGRAAYASLAEETEGGRLAGEWKVRLAEADRILGLVQALAEATQAERKPRRKLGDGSWAVTAATPETVTLSSKRNGEKVFRWSEREPGDALVLLTPARMTPDQRMSVAVLAASVADRSAFVDALLPVFEAGDSLEEANRLVARHLYGRAEAPEGGYSAYKGELLDRAGLTRRQTQERIETLRTQADAVLARIQQEPSLKKLAKLRDLRAELDKRRKYALTAIFNTTHYPYPYQKGSPSYQAVQHEIDRRVGQVAEVWDNPLTIRIKRAGKLAKLMDEWDLILAELDAKEVDTLELKKKIEPYAIYVTDEQIGIRTFYESQDERQWLAYSDWVRTQYNPARREEASDPEHRQVEITNDYRVMMGYTAVVTPGPAPLDSITKDNVIQILDQATLVKVTPLRAVRIDNRLVKAARLHSEDMARRGYFAHQAPPNPATGAGPTGPADRMQAQQYHGWSYSENIAMSNSPQQAHDMWCHSSGHHRNILSGWTDLGSGVGGRNFTQNFAGGGGARPEIYPDTTIRNREGGGGRSRARR